MQRNAIAIIQRTQSRYVCRQQNLPNRDHRNQRCDPDHLLSTSSANAQRTERRSRTKDMRQRSGPEWWFRVPFGTARRNTAVLTQKVTVIDDTPPAILNAAANPPAVWPPNRNMVDVTVN